MKKNQHTFSTDLEKYDDINWRLFIRLGWIIIGLVLTGFIVWAFLAPLDQGISASGSVIVASSRQQIQNPVSGVIENILVKEGQHVVTGQALVRMKQANAMGSYDAVRATLIYAMLTYDRLLAEQRGESSFLLPPVLKKFHIDEVLAVQLDAQNRLLRDRISAFNNELSSMTEARFSLEQQIASFSDAVEAKSREKILINDQLSRVKVLVEKGFASQASANEAEMRLAKTGSEAAEYQASINRLKGQIAEFEKKAAQRKNERSQEIRTSMAELRRDIDRSQAELSQAESNLEFTNINAPVDGEIFGLNVFGSGMVFPMGSKLMEIVPSKQNLLVQVQIPVHLIDQIKVGDQVELMVSSLLRANTQRLDGILETVGGDRLVNERTGIPFYSAWVRPLPSSSKQFIFKDMRPGMAVDVFIKTGQRSLVAYLLLPIRVRMRSALTEP